MIQDLKNDFKNDLCDTNILIIIIIGGGVTFYISEYGDVRAV